jgi:hypothetical protein
MRPREGHEGEHVVLGDAESGQRLWTPGTGPATRLIAWLPEVQGFIVSDRNGDPMLSRRQSLG